MPSYVAQTVKKHRWLFAAAVLAGVGVGTVVWTWGIDRTPPDPFAQDYTEPELAERIARGAAVFLEHNCAECHATTHEQADTSGAAYKGPPLIDIVGRPVELESGQRVERDHRYLRRAVRDSRADIVKGYRFQLMPDYGFFEEADIAALLLYLRSLGDAPDPAE